nr:nucleoside monophosphate kinase [Argonema antarcticum]
MFGLPGSGKGTQAQRLAEKFGLQHISCGDLFRLHIKSNSEFGQKATTYISRGELTPDKETTMMFLEHLAQQALSNTFVIEGFPRTLPQAAAIESFITAKDGYIKQAIFLDVEVEELVKRISGRRICPICGHIYNLYYFPPQQLEICEIDGALLERRTDDKEQLVRHRLHTYLVTESPVWEYFRTKSLLTKIDAMRPIEEVSSDICQILSDSLASEVGYD